MSSWQWLPAAFPMGIMVGALVLTGFGMDAGKNIFNKKVRVPKITRFSRVTAPLA
jgi:hypothetical protein